jgi:hypothetical protein
MSLRILNSKTRIELNKSRKGTSKEKTRLKK